MEPLIIPMITATVATAIWGLPRLLIVVLICFNAPRKGKRTHERLLSALRVVCKGKPEK